MWQTAVMKPGICLGGKGQNFRLKAKSKGRRALMKGLGSAVSPF